MKAMEKDWYQKSWRLDIQNMSWVEDTNRQVDFLIKQLQLKGTEKILDLACGFGRHSLEFARRGYDITGIDITPAYIDYANEQAKEESLNAKFFCQDIRTITFDKEFDVVLNMADGAIGHLEDDEENHKIFSVIAKALKKGGKHFMDIMNGSYAETHFPCKLFIVEDSGSGFTKEALLHGTEQFFMDDTSRNGEAHYGIGLFLAKTVAEKYGGGIKLSNSENTGGAKVKIFFMSSQETS